MPKVAYSEEDKERIKMELVTVGLELMAKQGIQHTTVEQIYKKVGISRTFFYSFFSTKEDLIVETLYLQQPKIIEQVQRLMADPTLSWRNAVKQFLYACCYGEKNGIAVLTIKEQQRCQTPIKRKLSNIPPKTAPSFRRNSRKLWYKGRCGKDQSIHKFESDSDGCMQGDS